MLSRLIDLVRGWGATTARTAPPREGELLLARVLESPAFTLGGATILDSDTGRTLDWGEKPRSGLMDLDLAYDMLERIEAARRACARHVGNPSLNPVRVSFIAMDWAEITHADPLLPDLKVSMPTILDGRWIGRDALRLLEIASTIVVDATLAPADGMDEIHALMQRLQLVATGLYTAHLRTDHDSGFHINLPSPFGPAEIRQHDISGSPYVAYDLPDTLDFADLPQAYEVQCRGHSLHVTRARIFNSSPLDLQRMEYEDQRRVLTNLARFDPTPKPDLPRTEKSRECFAVIRGRTILTVRRLGSDVFDLPGFVREADVDWHEAFARMERSIGMELKRDDGYDYVPGALEIGGYDGGMDLFHGISRYHACQQAEPAPHDEMVEVHWLNFDEPDRPVSEIMEHIILRNVRARVRTPSPDATETP